MKTSGTSDDTSIWGSIATFQEQAGPIKNNAKLSDAEKAAQIDKKYNDTVKKKIDEYGINYFLMFLQAESAAKFKEKAQSKITEIRAKQNATQNGGEALNFINKNKKISLKGDGDSVCPTGGVKEAIAYAANQVAEEQNISVPDPLSGDFLNKVKDKVKFNQENASSDIQQHMVYVQDYMGQYNSYTQGSSATLKTTQDLIQSLISKM